MRPVNAYGVISPFRQGYRFRIETRVRGTTTVWMKYSATLSAAVAEEGMTWAEQQGYKFEGDQKWMNLLTPIGSL